jgi:hypothetical protein
MGTIANWLSAIDYQLSAISCRLSAVGYWLLAIGYWLLAISHAAGYRLTLQNRLPIHSAVIVS